MNVGSSLSASSLPWTSSIGGDNLLSNPAQTAQLANLDAQASSTTAAISNIGSGLSLTSTAGGALGQISDALQQMRALTVQAGDGTYNASDLQAIQNQINGLGQTINQLAGGAQFNGQSLLNGNYSVSIQTGPNAGQTQTISLGNATAGALGVSGLDVSGGSGRTAALNAIDQAMSAVSSQQAQIGASQNALQATSTDQGVNYEALAQSAQQDMGPSPETSLLNQQHDAQMQAIAIRVQSMYESNSRNLLSLLNGISA